MTAGWRARACAQPRRTIAGDPTANGVPYVLYVLPYPRHHPRMRILGSADSLHILAMLPPLATWPWRYAPLTGAATVVHACDSGARTPRSAAGVVGRQWGVVIRRISRSPQRICSAGATWTSCVACLLVLHARTLIPVLDKKSRIPKVFIDNHALRFPPYILLLLISTRDPRCFARTTVSQRPLDSRTTTSACRSTMPSRAPRTSAGSSENPRGRADVQLDSDRAEMGAAFSNRDEHCAMCGIGSHRHSRPFAHIRSEPSPR
jgi:hypothetical protein